MALGPESLQILFFAAIAVAGGDAHLHHQIGRNLHIRQHNRLPGATKEAADRRSQPHNFFEHRIETRSAAGVVGA